MVSAGTEIGGYEPKLSFFGDKEVASMYACIHIDIYMYVSWFLCIIKVAICFHVITSKHKWNIAFNVLNE